jgi:rhodanese-related sulfurtransferase
MKRNMIAVSVIALLVASCVFVDYVPLSDMPLITKEQLARLIDNPKVTILDVRVDQDWTDSRQKIKGAVREEPRQFLAWAPKYPKDRQLVLYCE